MRLFKIILVFFAIYFIKRFIEMYRVMKRIQDEQAMQKNKSSSNDVKAEKTIDADFKIIN